MKNFIKNKKVILVLGLILVLGIAGVLAAVYTLPMMQKNKGLAVSEGAGMDLLATDIASSTSKSFSSSAISDRAISGSKPEALAVSSTEGSDSYIPSSQGGSPSQKDEEIKAGQLTAGEWNDLNNWSFWSNLMNNKEYAGYQNSWGFSLYNHYPVLVKQGETPVNDAKIILKDSNDNIIYQASTDNKGQATLFAGSFQQQESKNLSIIVKTNIETKTITDVKLDSNNALVINMESSQADSNILDLMFVMDTTGSMSDELEFLKSELKDVVKSTREKSAGLNIRLSCNYYRDHGDDYVIRPFEFTENIDDVVNQISSQSADGGGDYAEAVEEALDNAVSKHSWSESAKARLLFLVLDAPPHYTKARVEKLQEVVKKASANGIRIIPVASSGVDKETEFLLRCLGISTGGTYIFLTDDSGIGESHIQPTIGKYDVQLLNELLIKTINEYVSK